MCVWVDDFGLVTELYLPTYGTKYRVDNECAIWISTCMGWIARNRTSWGVLFFLFLCANCNLQEIKFLASYALKIEN